MSAAEIPAPARLVCGAAAELALADEARRLLTLSPTELAVLYARFDPAVDASTLTTLLMRGAQRFKLSGVDLLRTDTAPGMMVIEANSAPGFGYCTPGRDAWDWAYRRTADLAWTLASEEERPWLALLTENKLPCETLGFSAALSEIAGQEVPVFGPTNLAAARRERGGILHVDGRPVRGGIRYLHAAPWRLLPPKTPGSFVNPTDVDLAGARDKAEATYAFAAWNRSRPDGIPPLATPETVVVHRRDQLPDWEGWVVTKERHLNSGAGIRFFADIRDPGLVVGAATVVQRAVLPGSGAGPQQILLDGLVHDIRMVVASGPTGFFPMMVYARLSRRPWQLDLTGERVREALLTNIAVADDMGGYRFDDDRLVMPCTAGWRRLALQPVDFAIAFVQSVLATLAIDEWITRSPCAASAES